MKYRTASILDTKDLGASGTEIIDINLKDPISRINFIWKTTLVTVSVMLAPHMRCLTKVELVDGSDILHSLSGEEMQALNYYDQKITPHDDLSLTATDVITSTASIDFGRWLWDENLAFDPTKFRNPQLRITFDEDASNTSVVANSLTINADVFDEKKITPVGFLMSKEHKTWVPVASATEDTDLPTDHPYRKMMLRNKTTDKTPSETLDTFKISEDNDNKIPIDVSGDDLFLQTKGVYPRMEEKLTLDAVVTAKTLYVKSTILSAIDVNYDATAFVTAQSKFAVATVTNNKIALSASVDIAAVSGTVGGYAPHSTLIMPFGTQENINDWYDVTQKGKIQLKTTGNATIGTSPTAQLVLQQFRRY